MKLPFIPPRLSKIFKWHRFVPIKDWAEENIVLNKGATRGRFRADTAPHLDFIFEQIDKAHVNMVVMKVASQTQKTTTLLIAIMKWIATDYHDMFIMIPRASDIKKFLEFKIKPFIQGAKVVDAMMKDYNQEESERKHSHHYKTAQNLFSVISQNDTKSITTKYGVFDEAAEFEAGKIDEAMERMKTYGSTNKVLIASTQIHENDEINHFFNDCEVKYQQQLICPECGNHFYPLPSTLDYPTEKDYMEFIKEDREIEPHEVMSDYRPWASRKATLTCPHCEHGITDKERVKQIRDEQFKWVQVVPKHSDDIKGVEWKESPVQKDYYESVGIDTNTIFAMDVPLSKFAQMDIACKYAKPHEKQVRYEMYYVGWWNILYYPSDTSTVKKNDVLLLTNGLPIGVPPEDTNALHLGVDLQLDRLYFVVYASRYTTIEDDQSGLIGDIIDYGELYSDGVGNDWLQLREIIESRYTTLSGDELKISSVGVDIRGFSFKDPTSRSNEAMDFIFDYAVNLREMGVVDWDSFIFPTLGVDYLREDRFESQGYKVTKMERKMMIDGEEESIKVNALTLSNMRLKTIAFNMIERGIEKAKGEKDHENVILYITDEAVKLAEKRASLPKSQQRQKHSLEAHLTSEHLTYKILSTGKTATRQTYEKKYEGVRNDLFDCVVSTIGQTLRFNTHRTQKPLPQDDNEDLVKSITNLF